MSTSSELQREREVQGHLQSWHAAQGSPRNVALNVDNIPRLATGGGYKPQASPDKALSAFAQLAVLRLDMKRSMVSLIDATTETILSEATQNLLIGDLCAAAKASGSINNMAGRRCNNTINDLWLGSSSSLLRSEGICGNALESTCVARDPDGSTYTAAGLIVSDCRLDPRFATRPYVVADHGIRFYAGVPIISRKGHRIGVYAVTDEKPRAGLTIDELQFMQSVAQAVMDHLEWARDRVDHFKGQRIVRGLAAFIEGSSSVGVEANWVKGGATKPTTLRPPQMTVARSRRSPSHQNYHPESEPPSDAPAHNTQPAPAPLAKKEKVPKSNSLARLYRRAAEVLRDSTLADGVVLYGATSSNARPVSHDSKSGGYQSSDEDEHSAHATSGSEGVGMDSSDSDTSPTSRPCKVLAYSLLNERVHADIEDGPALSVGTLEKYFTLFPKGKGFAFCDEGRGISSEDDSASDRDAVGRGAEGPYGGKPESRPRPKVKMDHHELLKKIPGAKAVIFVPLFDYVEDRLAGGCFLWSSVPGRMINLDADLSYLRAFGNSIMSQVARINSQKNDAAKTTFIASMSHELRSPLHGILGAAEFLKDTHTDSYQTDLINSIFTCGRTLLETLNHVLDYSKINHLGHTHRRRGEKHHRLSAMGSNSDSINMTAVVDLGALVEEVVDAVAAGHTFKNLTRTYSDGVLKINNGESTDLASAGNAQDAVTVVLDICPKTSWMVRTQPGALRRIIMNLFGNSLKYTSSGSVLVSLRGQTREDGSKIDALIKVVDTGKGMSEEFQQNRLFLPFSQEDSFQPGTGLGLSIVKQIVKSLGGSLDLKSQQHKGTEVTVRLPLVSSVRGEALLQRDATMKSMAEKTKGLRVGLLGGGETLESTTQSPEVRMRNDVLAETCSNWFQMDVVKEVDFAESEVDIYLYCEPPPVQSLEKQLLKRTPKRKNIPMIIVCPSAEEAATVSQNHLKPLAKFSQIIEVIPQPCGPRKLANAFKHCLERAQKMAEEGLKEWEVLETPHETDQKVEASTVTDLKSGPTCVVTAVNEDQPDDQKHDVTTITIPPPLPHPADPQLKSAVETRPVIALKEQKKAVNGNMTRVLLVDDNAINLKLLVVFMKKCGFTYEEAENGQIAVNKFKEACDDCRRFDFILMDIGMPVMDGIEATKQIREHERENSLPLTNVIALTGLASADARHEVMSAGVDVFLAKPVRFAELKKMLTGR